MGSKVNFDAKLEAALLARCKPKTEPTNELLSPLYDQLEHAIKLINCAYYATHHGMIPDEVGDPIRAAIDDGVAKLNKVKDAMHDMVAWAPGGLDA